MLDNDFIQRFMFDGTNIRGEIIRLEKVLQQIYQGHNYPTEIKNLLAETLLCALLMSSTLKYDGQLTLQFHSKKALSLLLVKCDNLFQVRALAQYQQNAEDGEYHSALENGSLIVTIESNRNVKPYQSIVPLQGGIQQSIEHYFLQSEQLPTKFYLTATTERATGLMLQQMPNQENKVNPQSDTWCHLLTLTDTITDKELITLDNETLLYRLFHQDKCRLFQAFLVQFLCPCNKIKMLESIKLLGEDEALSILSTNKTINVTCEFCLENYAFEKNDVVYLFRQQ